MRWMRRGDLDGFFGLALDNLVQLLVIHTLCQSVLGFSDALMFQHVLPGVAVSLLIGNIFYARQALDLARRTGRTDVCALPYGINTPSMIAYIFLVMLPAKLAAEQAGAADPARVAWQAGLVAALGSGLIEFGGSFIAERIRKATPRAALLSTLAGIALGFISLGFLYRTFAHPVVGLTVLAIVMLTYFGRVRFKGGLPGGLVAVALGSLLAWWRGLAPVGQLPGGGLDLYVPVPVIYDLLEALRGGYALTYFSVILPMGIFNVIGSLQNIESAEAAGDAYPARPSLAVNGLGSIAAALFGSCFPTTIYIGHPGWKALGARAGYSILNGVFMSVVCLTGTLAYLTWAVPVDAGMAIVLWIGIVITAQAFQATPREHAPAVVMGLLIGVGAWGAFLIESTLRLSGYLAKPFNEKLVQAFHANDLWVHGAFAMEQGFIFSAMLLAAATVCVIERKFNRAACWCLAASALSAVGLMHSYRFVPGMTALELKPAWPWAAAYAMMALCFGSAKWLTAKNEAH